MTRCGFLILLLLMHLTLMLGSLVSPAYAFDEPHALPPGVAWPELSPERNTQQTPITDDMAERSRRWLVDHLDALSGGIDSFFVDRFFNDDVTEIRGQGSYARVSLFTRREIGEPVDYKFGISLNLELPHTNQRLNLLLQSEDQGVREGDLLSSPQNVTYSSALRLILQESERWSSSVDAGVRWGVPPDPFVRVRARRPFYASDWNVLFGQEINYYTQAGYGAVTSLTWDFPLTIHRLFRLESDTEYLLNDDFFHLSYGAGLYHEINRIYAYAVLAGAEGNTEYDVHFEEYTLGVRVRRKVWKEWMFAEVYPQMLWAEDNDWELTPVLMFRLEAEFSNP